MPGEGEEHRRIRERVEREVRDYLKSTGKATSHRVITAHQKGAGVIGLFFGPPSKASRLSEADLAIADDKNEVVCIVEVKDKDVRPKDICGIIGATSMCDTASHKAYGGLVLKSASMYIVISAKTIGKPKSTKRRQIELMNREVLGSLGSLSRVVICSEDEFAELLKL